MDMDKAVIIYGPTAVGKTDFAEHLAAQLDGEIINADAAQFYTPLTIGTAKPNWRSAIATHHLFDICDEPLDYSVACYRAKVQQCIDEIRQRGAVPIVVGGSGFYINTLFFPVGEHAKTEVTASDSFSWEVLNVIDPIRAVA